MGEERKGRGPRSAAVMRHLCEAQKGEDKEGLGQLKSRYGLSLSMKVRSLY